MIEYQGRMYSATQLENVQRLQRIGENEALLKAYGADVVLPMRGDTARLHPGLSTDEIDVIRFAYASVAKR